MPQGPKTRASEPLGAAGSGCPAPVLGRGWRSAAAADVDSVPKGGMRLPLAVSQLHQQMLALDLIELNEPDLS